MTKNNWGLSTPASLLAVHQAMWRRGDCCAQVYLLGCNESSYSYEFYVKIMALVQDSILWSRALADKVEDYERNLASVLRTFGLTYRIKGICHEPLIVPWVGWLASRLADQKDMDDLLPCCEHIHQSAWAHQMNSQQLMTCLYITCRVILVIVVYYHVCCRS